MNVRLGFGSDDSFRQSTAIIFNEAIFPFEKVSDRLRLNANFNTAQAGEKKIHFVHQAGLTALALAAGFYGKADFAALAFKQPPLWWKLVRGDEALRHAVKTFAAHGKFRIFAERLFTISKKIGAGDFALDHHGSAGAFPGNDVGRLTAGTGLFREDDTTTIPGTKPLFGKTDEHCMGHGYVVTQSANGGKYLF